MRTRPISSSWLVLSVSEELWQGRNVLLMGGVPYTEDMFIFMCSKCSGDFEFAISLAGETGFISSCLILKSPFWMLRIISISSGLFLTVIFVSEGIYVLVISGFSWFHNHILDYNMTISGNDSNLILGMKLVPYSVIWLCLWTVTSLFVKSR